MKKIVAARISLKLVVSVAKGNSRYVSKFQLSSSNSLGDMPFFVQQNEDQKETDFIIFLLKIWLLLKLPKFRDYITENFQSPKDSLKINFSKLCDLDIVKNFKLIGLYLVFFWQGSFTMPMAL